MAINTRELSQHIEELLGEAKIFDVGSYGWSNEDEVDPDFIGYAMWMTDPPFEHDFLAWQAGNVPMQVATPKEQRLLELGADFIGLLQAARFAIGSMLLHRDDAGRPEIDTTPF